MSENSEKPYIYNKQKLNKIFTKIFDFGFENLDDFENLSSIDLEEDVKNDDYKHQEQLKYQDLLEKIIDKSFDALKAISKSKTHHRIIFRNYFLKFLILQFIIISVIIIACGFGVLKLSDLILTTMIGSLFVETLGVVIIMVKYIFSPKDELGIIEAIKNVAQNYKIRK